MGDGFNEEEKLAYTQAIKEQEQAKYNRQREEEIGGEEYMDTVYDFHKYTADPSLTQLLSKKLKEINKNWVFGNFNPNDERVIAMCEELLNDINFLLPRQTSQNKIMTAIYRDLFSNITVSRGRKGFAAKLFVTQLTKGETKLRLDKTKKSAFSIKKSDSED